MSAAPVRYRLGCEDDDGRPVMPDCANPNGGCPCEPSHDFTERAWRPEDDDHALAQVLRRMLTDDDGDWANVSVDVHSGSSMLSVETPYLELAEDEARAVRQVMGLPAPLTEADVGKPWPEDPPTVKAGTTIRTIVPDTDIALDFPA